MKKKIVRISPANHSPETIKDVLSIVLVEKKKDFGSVDVVIVHLKGTIEEKLQQYKDATGVDWNGFNEQVFTEIDQTETICLNLGPKPLERILSKADIKAQRAIDALTAEAKLLHIENETVKQKWVAPKEVETLTI